MSIIFEPFTGSVELSQKSPSSNFLSKSIDKVKPPTTSVEHTSEKQDLAALLKWLRGAPIGVCEFKNISLEEAAYLQKQLIEEGHRVR